MGILGCAEPTGHRDAVFGLWERDGRILLVRNPRRFGGRDQPVWELPGGAVQPGESLTEALARECLEEIGLDVEVGDLLHVADGTKRRDEDSPPLYTWRAFVFTVESQGIPVACSGVDAVAWILREEASASLSAPYHAPLRSLLQHGGPAYGAVGWIDPVTGNEDAGIAADGLRRLLSIAACAAAGADEQVGAEVEAARAAGVTARRIEETLLQIVPFAGFPRAIAALGAARARLGAHVVAEHSMPSCATGPKTFDAVYGGTAGPIRAELAARHPDLLAWIQAFAYGKVLARPVLTLLERELLAVSILTSLGNLEGPLLGHMRACVRLGAEAGDVAAAVTAVPHALGEANREAARALLSRL